MGRKELAEETEKLRFTSTLVKQEELWRAASQAGYRKRQDHPFV